MKTYIVKLVVVDDLGSWGPRTSTSTIFFGENYVCICSDVYTSLKSQNHTESSILKKKKKKSLAIALPKIYMCVFCYNGWLFFDKGSIEYLEINS